MPPSIIDQNKRKARAYRVVTAIDKVATGNYYTTIMAPLKTVGIKALKNHLSTYVRDARAGARILITDRDEVVAELHQPEMTAPGTKGNPLLLQWAREGKVRPPRPRRKKSLPVSPLRLAAGTALRLLTEDRGE